MKELKVEIATVESIKAFVSLVGSQDGIEKFMAFEGTQIFKVPFDLKEESELIVCKVDRRPMTLSIMERHFKHTQTFIPMDGKPFIMILAPNTEGPLPDPALLRAFLFKDVTGIAMHLGVCHEFPFVLEDATQFAVVLSSQSHQSDLKDPPYEWDGEGADLERRNLYAREGYDFTIVM
jgi:ureidoglycolate lyase